jgi:glycine oxidase
MPRIAILGAGLIGLSCAWHLARDGHRVVLLDTSREPRESSWAAAGMLAPHHEALRPDPLWRLCSAGLAGWPPFLASLGLGPDEVDWRAGGGWIRATETAELDRLEGDLAWLRAAGIEVLRLGPAAYARACPGVAPGAGSLWLPGAQVDPRRVLPALRAACQAAGVVDACGSPVTTLEAGGARTADGILHEVDELVLASGAWSPGLAALVGVAMSGTPVKGQMVRLAGPCRLAGFVRQGHNYLMSRRDGSVVVGATMVEAGFERSEDPAAIASLAAWAVAVVPALAGATPSETWTGLRPRLSSGLPVIGRVRPGLCVATGHFRNGVLLAPLTGSLIADLVAGRGVGDAALAFDPLLAMG